MEPPLLILSFVLMGMFHDAELMDCKPDCSGFSQGVLVADPLDCRRYYECQSNGLPSATSVRCPSGYNFDPFNHICGPFTCIQDCEPCQFTCITQNDYIVDPVDCSKYYFCDYNLMPQTHGFCPEGQPYFDSVNNVCSNDKSVCCNLGCEPYCKIGIIFAPDSYDCLYYFDCNQEPPFRTMCTGSVFHIGRGLCIPDADCITWCPQIPPTDPISTKSTPTIITPPGTGTPTPPGTGTPTPPGTGTPTPPGTGLCLESFPCAEIGFFPKCPDECDPRYFYCQSVGPLGVEDTCPGDDVFNPIPSYPYCIPTSECPRSM